MVVLQKQLRTHTHTHTQLCIPIELLIGLVGGASCSWTCWGVACAQHMYAEGKYACCLLLRDNCLRNACLVWQSCCLDSDQPWVALSYEEYKMHCQLDTYQIQTHNRIVPMYNMQIELLQDALQKCLIFNAICNALHPKYTWLNECTDRVGRADEHANDHMTYWWWAWSASDWSCSSASTTYGHSLAARALQRAKQIAQSSPKTKYVGVAIYAEVIADCVQAFK